MELLLLPLLVIVGLVTIAYGIGDFVESREFRARPVISDTNRPLTVVPVSCGTCQCRGEFEIYDGLARCPDCAGNNFDPTFEELYEDLHESEETAWNATINYGLGGLLFPILLPISLVILPFYLIVRSARDDDQNSRPAR